MQCTMFAYSTSPHVSQLYTGFSLLSTEGVIRLKQKFSNYLHPGLESMTNLRPRDLNGLFVILDEAKTIYYDTSEFVSSAKGMPLEILPCPTSKRKLFAHPIGSRKGYSIPGVPSLLRGFKLMKTLPPGKNWEPPN